MNVEIIIGEIGAVIIALYGLFSLNKLILSNKLLAESNKLKSMIAKFRQDFGDVERNPNDFVAGSLQDIGIGGLLEALKVNPDMISSLAKEYGIEIPGWAIPLIKGFLSKQGAGNVTSEKPKHPSQM